MIIELACWHCGKTTPIVVKDSPHFAFEVAGWANDIGWHGYLDHKHQRSLVFCTEEHANAERTKAGTFRARPKGINRAASLEVANG